MKKPTFPNKRKKVNSENVYYVESKIKDPNAKRKFEERKTSKEATIYKSQFLSVERALLDSFQFVSPSNKNKKTFSVKFASIIKEAANTYELVSKTLYGKLYNCTNCKIRNLEIPQYLSLDIDLELSLLTLDSHLFYNRFELAEVYEPFSTLKTWDKSTELNNDHIPKWWKAHNKLKHSNEGLESFATLENAIAAVGANFIILHKTYGPGFIDAIPITFTGKIRIVQASTIFVIV